MAGNEGLADPPPGERGRPALVAAVLVLLAAAAYEGVRHLGFLAYDDDLFVTQNPWIRTGLGWRSVAWALRADLTYDSPHADYFAPLTVLSRILDVELFGMSPAGHHLTNLFFHAAAVALAFFVLRELTGATWPSAFAAGVLAVHPLHVESVAWVTERKDVLSLLFWLVATACYARWARGPTRARWAFVLAVYAAGLLCKPSLVALPVVLLFLDRWPLGRREPWSALLREKWPLFALSAGSVALTVAANLSTGLVEGAALPVRLRVANALDAYVAYLADAFWPVQLGVGHAHRGATLTAGRLAFCAVLLAGLTAAFVHLRRRRPYLVAGWAWFVVALLPTIGILQSGLQGRADRFMYVPLLGLSLAAGMLGASWARGSRARAVVAGTLAVGVLLALLPVTRAQVRTWRDDVSLFTRAAAVDPESPIAANGLGAALGAAGDLAGAERELRRALLLKPDFVGAQKNLASLLAGQGRAEEAAAMVERSLATWAGPGSWARPETLFTLALVRSRQGRPADALALYEEVLRLDGRHWAGLYNSGNLLAAAGRLDEAGARYGASLRGNRDNVDAHRNLGLVRLMQGRVPEALESFRAGLRVDPSSAPLHTGLGRALAAAGRVLEAEAELREGVRLAPRSGEAHFQLAEALRSSGAGDEARAHYREALRLDPSDTRARAALAAP